METAGDGDSSSRELAGLDAKIPGGKFDSAISDERSLIAGNGYRPIRKY